MSKDPVWPPADASSDEISQLVELIRMGMIDTHGAPSHVLRWYVQRVDANGLPRSIRGGGDAGGRSANIIRSMRGDSTPARTPHENLPSTQIELPRRNRRSRRTLPAAAVDPLPLYVRDADLDASHYPITYIPEEFPPLPPDFAPLESISSDDIRGGGEILPSSRSSMLDDDSEIGSRRTMSLRENEDAPLTGLTPRPPPPAVLAP